MTQMWWSFGRFLYGIPLFITGTIYLVNPQGSVETLTSFIPGGVALIYVAGSLYLVLGLSIAFGWLPRWASWGAIALLGIVQVMVHIPAVYAGEHLTIVWFELLRDLSLMGGAFLLVSAEESRARVAQPEA